MSDNPMQPVRACKSVLLAAGPKASQPLNKILEAKMIRGLKSSIED